MDRSLKKILVLSIWENVWSMGEESGPSDEYHFIRYLTGKGIELHFLIPEPSEGITTPETPLLAYHTYPNIFRTLGRFPDFVWRVTWPLAFPSTVNKRVKELAASIEPDILLGLTYYSTYTIHKIGTQLGIPTALKLFGVMYLNRFDYSPIKYWWCNYEPVAALRHPLDHYIVLNDGTQGDKALLKYGVPPEKISFLPNGMDTEWADTAVDRTAARKSFGLPDADVLVVTLSRLTRSKRLGLFLEAVSLIDPGLYDRTTFVIAGDGPDRQKLERKTRELGLENHVFFTGAIARNNLPIFYKASDIFVGTNELTNMSLPPCEAILCGVPVVAFDVAGTSEVVHDGETGLLVTEGDIKGLAKKIELLITDHALRKSLGEQAAVFGAEHFISWDERMKRELEVLEKVVRPRS